MKKYIVLFGNDRFYPELHYNACRNRFDSLKDAREYARGYINSYVFRVYDDGAWFIQLKI